MRKLTLDVDSLVVQSFQTTTPDGGRGTVLGQGVVPGQGVVGPDRTPGCESPLCIPSEWHTCPETCRDSCYGSCDSCNSCIASCNGTCHGSCNGTCEDSCGGTCWLCVPPTDPAIGLNHG